MRRAAAVALVLAASLAAAVPSGPAAAQEGPAPPPAPKAEDAAPVATRFRALDISAMFAATKPGGGEPAEIPLAQRTVRALLPGGRSVEAMTDADGIFTLAPGSLRAGESVEFVVPAASADPWPLWVGPPVKLGPGQPGELAFVRVHDGPNPVEIGSYLQTVTVPDREEGTPTVRVNLFASLRNTSDGTWVGKRGAAAEGTFRLRVPKDFTVVAAQLSGEDVRTDLVPRADGDVDVVLRDRIYPVALTDREQMFRVVLTGPWREDGVYDFSFRAESAVHDLRVNLETNVLHYEPSGDVELADGGPNPPMANRETHGWTASHVKPGQVVGIRVRAGRTIDRRVWYTLGGLAAVIFAAVLLGRTFAMHSPARAADAALSAGEKAQRLDELDRRLRRGEITKFEHAARRKLLEDGPRPAAARPAEPPHDHGSADPRRVVQEIASRADTADAATLRRDVKTLVALARELLR